MKFVASLKHNIKNKLTPENRLYIKKIWRKISTSLQSPMSIDEFQKILLNRLVLSKNDTVIFSSSFGRLKADFSPSQALTVLMEIVSSKGNIIMPYYPRGLSSEWLESCQIFDMQRTKSGMGILTQVFSEMQGVVKSKHPTKSVVAWGKDAEYIVKGHELSITPFDTSSPYKKILDINGSKSIGLGIIRIPIFHSTEDLYCNYSNKFYSSKIYESKLKDYDGSYFTVRTRAHDDYLSTLMATPADFLHETQCPSFNQFSIKGRLFFTIDHDKMFNHVNQCYAKKINRFSIKNINKIF